MHHISENFVANCSLLFCSGWEERSLFSGGRSGRPRSLQAGGGGVGKGAAGQAEWQHSAWAQLYLIKPLHAWRVLAGWAQRWQSVKRDALMFRRSQDPHCRRVRTSSNNNVNEKLGYLRKQNVGRPTKCIDLVPHIKMWHIYYIYLKGSSNLNKTLW